MPTYAVYDTTEIQSYIFASNKLAENKGASELVGKVLKETLPDVLEITFGEENVIIDWDSADRRGEPLEADNAAEIIYIGGGNAYVAFADEEKYNEATKAFLLKVYDETSGIGIASACVETDFEHGYIEQHKELHSKLAKAKGQICRPIPAGNQPITQASRMTGLPVTVITKENELLSAEQNKKREARKNALEKERDESEKSETEVITEFDALKRGNGFLAVIHADGNSMGTLIEQYCKVDEWGKTVPRVREMSYRISKLYDKAYEQTKRNFAAFCKERFKDTDFKQKPLPLIKIIGDGDDITCVTAGQFGISFAAELLREVEKLKDDKDLYPFKEWFENPDRPLVSACAGVAIFHSHYPFSAAYKIAEDCCGNAKRYTRKAKEYTDKKVGSFIDFHLHRSGMVASLKDFREQQYKTANKDYLLQRPYCVSNNKEAFEGKYPLFSEFERLMKWGAAQYGVGGTWPRSRLKALRSALGASDAEVEEVIEWCESRDFTLPEYKTVIAIDDRKDDEKKMSEHAPLFDVLDVADLYEDICGKEAQ